MATSAETSTTRNASQSITSATFFFGFGLRLIFTARPESATSLTTLRCETSLRRDHRKMPRDHGDADDVSMMMPTTPNERDERRERAHDAGRRAG